MRELVFSVDGPVLMTTDEVDAMLEIAYLAVHADGVIAPEEREIFVERMVGLYAGTLSPGRARWLVEQLELPAGDVDPAYLVHLTLPLKGPAARREAYKVALAITLADRQRNEPEVRFEAALRKALGLDDEEAESLLSDVIAAMREG